MTSAVEQVFTDQDAGLFVELERVIERGLKTFIVTGQALTEIRERRLYRLGDYTTFDEYCHQRWGFNDSRARQLIAAAQTVTTVTVAGLPAPANERQARELARVPEHERADVWAEARDRAAGRPTAETIRGIVKERQTLPEPKPAPETSSAPDPAMACEACGAQMVKDQIAESYRNLSDTLNAIPPERIAEINESVKPAVEFGQLVSACRQFAEMLARIDLDYAARGIDIDQLPTIRKTLDLARHVEQIIGVPT